MMDFIFWLGPAAEEAAREQAEADQRAVEYAEMVARQAPVVDATDIDE